MYLINKFWVINTIISEKMDGYKNKYFRSI